MKPAFDKPHPLRARELRKSQTDAERKMWALLRNRRLVGFKFRRQQPIGSYIIDFYCPEFRLAVEIDGVGHMSDEQRRYDLSRSEFISSKAITIIRFWDNEVLNDSRSVLQQILDVAEKTRI